MYVKTVKNNNYVTIMSINKCNHVLIILPNNLGKKIVMFMSSYTVLQSVELELRYQ